MNFDWDEGHHKSDAPNGGNFDFESDEELAFDFIDCQTEAKDEKAYDSGIDFDDVDMAMHTEMTAEEPQSALLNQHGFIKTSF